MKQQLDEVRTLAVKLFEAGQVEKRNQPPEIWGSDRDRKFRDLPSESVAVWDAVALAAAKELLYQRWCEKRLPMSDPGYAGTNGICFCSKECSDEKDANR